MTQPPAINKKLVLMYTLRHVNNREHLRVATKQQRHSRYVSVE